MAITTAMCNSFKGEILKGIHNLTSNTIKLALIKTNMSGTYGPDTQRYNDVTANSDEATGTNYSAGGQTLDSITISTNNTGDRAFVDIANEEFSNVTVAAQGCIIYNSSVTGDNGSNPAIAVIDFGGSGVAATAGDLTIEFPLVGTNGATAVIRIE